jgi:hypothetical protein
MYLSMIFGGQLMVEHHSHAPDREKSTETIRSLLCAVAEQHTSTGVS